MSDQPGGRISVADVQSLDFSKGEGLLPAVVQDAESGAVLMVGYMNRDALRETSGHTLDLVDVRTDCDRDSLLVTANPRGPVCHVGTVTCFGNEKSTHAERLSFLGALEGVIESRIADRPDGSYTARLYAEGAKRIAQKVGEEGLEVALAAVAESDEKVIAESADLVFHLLVLLKSRGVSLERVARELEARHSEKNPR